HTRFSRDWSSDVCSSDLDVEVREVSCIGLCDQAPAMLLNGQPRRGRLEDVRACLGGTGSDSACVAGTTPARRWPTDPYASPQAQIGRASCRGRVEISVVA